MTTPEAKAAREKRLTRSINIVMWTVLGMFLALLLLAPSVINASRNSNDQKRSDEISACRSVANSSLNDARTARAEASTAEARARNQVEDTRSLITEVAIFDRDPARLTELRGELVASRTSLQLAEAAADKATKEERRQNDIYAGLSRLSLEDPDEFLATCKADT